MKTCLRPLLISSLSLMAAVANAGMIMPDFANAPTGWTTDRYTPNSFSDIGPFQGRNDVLGIGLKGSDFQGAGSFYNTQGKGYYYANPQAQGAGSVLSADLYIPAGWQTGANGPFRSDMWAVGVDGTGAVADYAIIGFTDLGGTGRYRIWDDQTGVWTDLASPVAYNAWTSFSISFDGSAFKFGINGTQVGAMANNGSTSISGVIMQAYNFGGDYTADWSNTPVPEPTTVLAGALLMLPLGASALRVLRRKQAA